MNWSAFLYAIGAVVCLASADFFLKLSSTRISSSVGTLVYAMTAVLPPLVWVLWNKFSNSSLQVTKEGVLASIIVGLSFSLVVAFFSLTYAAGANLSVATPTIRMIAIVAVSALGIVVLREDFTLRYALGVVLTFAGVYFILTR